MSKRDNGKEGTIDMARSFTGVFRRHGINNIGILYLYGNERFMNGHY